MDRERRTYRQERSVAPRGHEASLAARQRVVPLVQALVADVMSSRLDSTNPALDAKVNLARAINFPDVELPPLPGADSGSPE